MTTTHHHHHDETVAASSGDTVRKTRLGTLLIRRKRLAVRWAEDQSHHLPEADDVAHELAVVEQAIGHCYPAVYNGLFPGWVAHDAALLHAPDSPLESCRLCTALALPRAA
jgi:hypothetical protein